MESLNLLQLLIPGEQLRSSDEQMQEFKAIAVKHRYLIKNYLNVTISEKLTSVAIAVLIKNPRKGRISLIIPSGSIVGDRFHSPQADNGDHL